MFTVAAEIPASPVAPPQRDRAAYPGNCTADTARLRLSVVVPCFNDEEVLEHTPAHLRVVCTEQCGEDYEIAYVGDCSQDRTWSLRARIAGGDPRVVAVSLPRDFGHQRALSAGLAMACGERVLMIDTDLQDPPELLGRMMSLMGSGVDVVYGERTVREGETAFKKGSASLFYRLLNRLTDIDIPENVDDFRLVNRVVLDALLSMPEQHRFIRGLVAWLDFRQQALPYVRHPRFAGETKYPLRKMLRLAVDAITGFSVKPLHLSMLFAMAAFAVASAVALYVLVIWLAGDTVRGWASLTLVVAFFAGVQLLVLAILGEYLGRTFVELKGRRCMWYARSAAGSPSAPAPTLAVTW